jgi:hypothetical protein
MLVLDHKRTCTGSLPVKPERIGGVDLEIDDEFPANVLGVELIESSVESAIICAGFGKGRLSYRVVQLEEVEADDVANICIELIGAIDKLPLRSNLDVMGLLGPVSTFGALSVGRSRDSHCLGDSRCGSISTQRCPPRRSSSARDLLQTSPKERRG